MIELRVFGSTNLRAPDGREVQSILSRPKRLALLAYLAAARPRGFHRRDALLALFWPDLDQAHGRNALRQALHFLRAELEREVLVSRGEQDVALDPQRLWCDVAEFEKHLDAGEPRSALKLYRGDLLAAFHVSDLPEFERWMDQERDYLRHRATRAALELVQEEEIRGDPLRGVRWANRALEISPYDEGALRGLLRLLDQAGDRAEAVHEFEAFARRLAADLDVTPAPETAALATAIRARAASRGIGSPEASLPTAPHAPVFAGAEPWRAVVAHGGQSRTIGPVLRGLRFRWRVVLSVVAVVLLGGMVVVSRSRKPAELDPQLLAVAPFRVLDPKLELWREGLVDVLSRNLDGAGPFRTVSPTVVIRRWKGWADGASARELGHRTGAGIVLFGQLTSIGGDSVRLSAALLDARNNRILTEIDRKGQVERIDRLADSLTLDAIQTLLPSAGNRSRLSVLGTRSLPALKAFLRGERFLRHFVLDSAVLSYDRAVALDPVFALALRRLQWTLGWKDSASPDYFVRAAAANHGLSPRDSLLVLSDSGFAGRASAPEHPAFAATIRRRFAVLKEAARRYPADPEVWYQLGEAEFHGGAFIGAGWKESRYAFDRAIRLDSGFAPAYIHPLQIALNDNDPDAARKYIRGYLGIGSLLPDGGAMRLLEELLSQAGTHSPRFSRELEVASPLALSHLGFAVHSWPDVNETQLQVWPRALEASRVRLTAGDSGISPRGPIHLSMLRRALIYRGHLHEARLMVGNSLSMPFMELAKFGIIPRQTVDSVLDQWFGRGGDEEISFYPWFVAGSCCRTLDAALWWASLGDMARLERLVQREVSAARSRSAPLPAYEYPVPEFAHAALALARGDTATALSGFLAFPDSLCPEAEPLREVRFRLLAAVGRGPEAAALFDRYHEQRVPLMLERARLAELLGDRSTAIKYFGLVAQAWLHADRELQPVVAQARAGIMRLGGKPPS